MLSPAIEKALNEQLKNEFYASHLYLSMSSWAANHGLPGIAKWLETHATEEYGHAMQFFHYINDCNGKAIVPAVDAPPADFDSLEIIFQEIYKHEKMITKGILERAELAFNERDLGTWNWIQWAIKEQHEEETLIHTILDKIKLAGDNLYQFDRDIAELQ